MSVDIEGLMKLITPFNILNQNFHEMDSIREAMKLENQPQKDCMMIKEKFIKTINLLR